jgi:2-dehydro-3-deoxy-L-rhamnonate dehydrogenase (NAD+)
MTKTQQRHAIVTGGSQGIGLATIRRLQADGYTAHIFDLAAGPEASYAEAIEQGAVFHQVDVTDLKAVEEAVAACQRVDVLVTSAGIAGPNMTTWEYPPHDWRKIMSINLDGTWHCLRAAAPRMIEQEYGRIVTVSSVAGKEGNPNAPAYSASKAGVIALTKSMGKELAKYNIAVNCVTPAAARTRIFDQMKQEHIDFMLSRIPRGRFLKVEEAAAMIGWLASEECSFSTGAIFDLTGGRSTY